MKVIAVGAVTAAGEAAATVAVTVVATAVAENEHIDML